MKVKKSTKINSCNSSNIGTNPISSNSNLIQHSPYEEAKGYIQSAISSLSIIANDDNIAKESIANLAVVLMDLQ